MITEVYNLRYWADTKTWYCTVKFPDGQSCELKGLPTTTCDDWATLAEKQWLASQPEPPIEPLLLDNASKEELLAECKERGITAKDLDTVAEVKVGD